MKIILLFNYNLLYEIFFIFDLLKAFIIIYINIIIAIYFIIIYYRGDNFLYFVNIYYSI